MQRAKPTKIVAMVGFMGAGKTTVGRSLARALRWRFVDLDDWIERRTGTRIPDLFAAKGEAAFRDIESIALQDVLSDRERDSVLALGGGAYVQPRNAAALHKHCARVVFLDASLDELVRRCCRRPGARPLFQDENQFRQLYEVRRPSYMQADIRLVTDGMKVSAVVAQLLDRLGLSAPVADSPARRGMIRE